MKTLACQNDPYLRELDLEVVSCKPHEHGFLVLVRDSVLYPEGGGQPADHGWLGEGRINFVEKTDEGVLYTSDSPVLPGKARAVVDWGRRYDHMQQHTAQHLVTALAHDRFGFSTVAFHLGAETSSIDLDGSPTDAQLREIELATNEEIRRGRRVSARLVAPEDMSPLGVRTRGLPDGHVGQVRLVEIEGIDLNTCGGTHVAGTGELQLVLFVATEKVKAGLRLHYLAGRRALARALDMVEREAALNKALSCGPSEHVAAVEKLKNDAKEAAREASRMQTQLAGARGAELARAADGVALHHEPGVDLRYLQTIAKAALDQNPNLLLLLTTADGERGSGTFLLAGPDQEVTKVGPQVAEMLGGRGGGSRGRYQGKAQHVERAKDALELMAGCRT